LPLTALGEQLFFAFIPRLPNTLAVWNEPLNSAHLLSASVTPIVLVSACGLVTLALYNRLGAILARLRAFHQQKVELLQNLHEHEGDELLMLLDMLDSQIEEVTLKAKVMQKGLYYLLTSMAAFLVCSLFAGATVLHEWMGMIALGMHFIGLCLFLVGLGWAMRELTLSVTPLEEESAYLKVLTAHHLEKSRSGHKPRLAKCA
jgi:hypothetical protein